MRTVVRTTVRVFIYRYEYPQNYLNPSIQKSLHKILFMKVSVHQDCPARGPRAQIWAPARRVLGPLGLKYMH